VFVMVDSISATISLVQGRRRTPRQRRPGNATRPTLSRSDC
jgi:hypothetical protein